MIDEREPANLIEKILTGRFEDRHDDWVFESAFHCDGKEMLLDRIYSPQNLNLILPTNFLLQNRRAREDPVAFMAKRLQGCAIFKLPDQGCCR